MNYDIIKEYSELFERSDLLVFIDDNLSRKLYETGLKIKRVSDYYLCGLKKQNNREFSYLQIKKRRTHQAA